MAQYHILKRSWKLGRPCLRSYPQILGLKYQFVLVVMIDVFRASVQSDRSGSSLSISPYRYDEVSLSSNFSKPVVVRSDPVKQVDKPQDFFSGFSFSSPLGWLSMKLLFPTFVMVWSFQNLSFLSCME